MLGPLPYTLYPRSCYGGEAGIRTRGEVSPAHALQACQLSRSCTSPQVNNCSLFTVDGSQIMTNGGKARFLTVNCELLTVNCNPAKRDRMAEREGFEPPEQLPAQRFSRPPDSATLAPLHLPQRAFAPRMKEPARGPWATIGALLFGARKVGQPFANQ